MKSLRNSLVIYSGGQTGVDRAALDFAWLNDISSAGWCPLMRKAEDGFISLRYPLLQTHLQNHDYRTELNVLHTDATLIVSPGHMDNGTQLTHDLVKMYRKPLYVWIIDRNEHFGSFHRWLKHNNINSLNIAGPRESHAPGIYDQTLQLMDKLFEPFLDE